MNAESWAIESSRLSYIGRAGTGIPRALTEHGGDVDDVIQTPEPCSILGYFATQVDARSFQAQMQSEADFSSASSKTGAQSEAWGLKQIPFPITHASRYERVRHYLAN